MQTLVRTHSHMTTSSGEPCKVTWRPRFSPWTSCLISNKHYFILFVKLCFLHLVLIPFIDHVTLKQLGFIIKVGAKDDCTEKTPNK